MSFPRELIGLLVVLVLFLGWLAALLGSVALTLREHRRPPEARRWWARHAFLLFMVGTIAPSYALSPVDWSRQGPGDNPALWSNLAFCLAVAVAGIAWSLIRHRSSPVVRAHRKALRGDLPGAIADAEAALGPDLEPPDAAPSGGPSEAANPWAPPASAGPSPRDRAALAARLNLLGWLETQRGDWPRALGFFERADALGTGLMIYRTNCVEVLLRLGRHGEAGPLLDQALAAVPEHNSAQAAQLLTEVAESLTALGRLDEARAALGRAERHWRQLGPLRLAYRGPLLAPLRAARAALELAPAGADVPA